MGMMNWCAARAQKLPPGQGRVVHEAMRWSWIKAPHVRDQSEKFNAFTVGFLV